MKLRIARDFELETERFADEGLRVGIFASPGAGKGYLLGVLLEEFIEAGFPCVMVDPESELWTFREIGALVVGGEHGHVPLAPGSTAAIEEALRFCHETATPVVFDLGDQDTDVEIREAFEAVARPYWRFVNRERTMSVFAVTEAHVVAPQAKPPGEKIGTTLPALLTRGRKRGATVLLETQRIADIAKSVISHCNVRFIGRIDFEDDFKRVAKGMPGVSVAEVQALERGTFYVPRFAKDAIKVRKRRVTHGAPTPGTGDVQIRREATPGAVAELAKRLAVLIPESAEPSTAKPAGAKATVRRVSEASAREREELERDLGRLQKQIAKLEAAAAERERQLGVLEERAKKAEKLNARVAAFQRALLDLVGEGMTAGESGGVGYPGDDHVLELIREHAPAGGRPVLQPVEALRSDFLERAAGRLVETMRALEADEREALLFLLTRDTFVTVNAIALGISGDDGGGTRNRWSKATQALAGKGLVRLGSTGGTMRKQDVDGWVRRALAPHEPSDDEVAAVRDRALYVLREG